MSEIKTTNNVNVL